MKDHELERFTFRERVIHWLVGLSLSYLLLTGLAFAYPRLYWILDLLGGAQTSRWLHPWIGMVFTVGLVLMYWAWAAEMVLDSADRDWFRAMSHYARHEKSQVPPTGKYNGGQKLFFWAQIVLGAAHIITGLFLWFPATFGTSLGPLMRFIHFAVTLPNALLMILHIYLGTVLFPGTARGILYGTVTRAWAKLHHPIWYREQGGD